MYNIILPSQVWQDFDAESTELDERLLDEQNGEKLNLKTYSVSALTDNDMQLRVTVKLYSAYQDSDSSLLIVPEYHQMPSEMLINDLVSSGFNLIIPDIAGNDQPPTVYPKRYAYGKFTDAGDHIKKVMPSAKDTCQYLYSLIVKRVMVFAKKVLNIQKIALMGLGDAVEVAMQVAGSGGKPDALALVNGGGYREYIKLNKFGGGKELVMDEERICWLSGVASVAYAKYITAPVFMAIGTNSDNSDIDRVTNLAALLPHDNLVTSFSPRANNFILPDAYASLKIWLKRMLMDEDFPTCPTTDLKVSEEGKIYAYVNIDPSLMVESVSVYYSLGEYNHGIRNWQKADAVSAAYSEYLATIVATDAEAALFAFAKVNYQNGITLTSLVDYIELSGHSVKAKQTKPSKIIYEPSYGISSFVECCKDEVLMATGLNIVETPCGVKGLTASVGSLITYALDIPAVSDDSLLQIDLFSEKQKVVNIYVQEKTESEVKRYHAVININDTKGFFIGTKLKVTDLKDDRLMPLDSWENICSLEVEGQDVVIGNILFI